MPKKVNKKTGKSKQKTTDDQVWVIRKEDFQKALDLLERAIEEPFDPTKASGQRFVENETPAQQTQKII